jgi:hypothetical protein
MTQLYQFLSRSCGAGAILCAMLAVLATSPSALGDEPSTCEECCTGKGYTGYQYQQCMFNCQQGYGECGEAIFSCERQMSNCVNWNCVLHPYCVKQQPSDIYCTCVN